MESQKPLDYIPVAERPASGGERERKTMEKWSNSAKQKLKGIKYSEMMSQRFSSICKMVFLFTFVATIFIFWFMIILASSSFPKSAEYSSQEKYDTDKYPVDNKLQNWMMRIQESAMEKNSLIELNDSLSQKIQSELLESIPKILKERKKRSANGNEIETQGSANICTAKVQQCKSLLESMKSTTVTAVNSIKELMSVLNRIEGQTEELKLQEFLQCIECQIAQDKAKSRGVEIDDSPKKYNIPIISPSITEVKQRVNPNQGYQTGPGKPGDWQYQQYQQQQPEKGSQANPSIPPTAETIKTSQQIQMSPSYGPYPICPYNMPVSQSAQYAYPSSYGYYQPPPQPMMQNPPPNQGPVNYPVGSYGSFPAYSHGVYPVQGLGPTASGQLYPSGAARQTYPCYFVPTNQMPITPGGPGYQRNSELPGDSVQSTGFQNDNGGVWVNKPGKTNEIYYANYEGDCELNEYQCQDESTCIPIQHKCDGKVDCGDASDETTCSCKDRIDKVKLCDGYFDCPLGEDELGCFGCQNNSFSCQERNSRKRVDICIPLYARCDGIKNCPNGKDEVDCTVLTESYTAGDGEEFMVGYVQGFLHRNLQGRWYPACSETVSWARDACQSETGDSMAMPKIQIGMFPHGTYNGPYIAQLPSGEIRVLPSCEDRTVHVTCPASPCGIRVLPHLDSDVLDNPFEDSLVAAINPDSPENVTNSDNKNSSDVVGITNDSRVIGGRASSPKAWPFIVAIYRNGFFLCGGVIINENWILTAAHCLENYQLNYYEIRAGLLRRYSYSPSAQTRKASFITTHPDYDEDLMTSDIGLIKLERPLRFNRWVKATCLPKNISKEPRPGSECIAVGWGATAENGGATDELMEVAIPILKNCKYADDQDNEQICAGTLQGGKDTCQGDSGGPLMCKVPKSSLQWYTAGIVSHGRGCGRPNEPGVYTRVSKFIGWIEKTFSDNNVLRLNPKPLSDCPGFICGGGLGKCLPNNRRCDKKVDCPDAEDEMNCVEKLPRNHQPGESSQTPNKTESADAQSKNVMTNEINDDKFSTTSESSIPESTNSELNTSVTTTELPVTSTTTEVTSTVKWELPDEPTTFICKTLIQTLSIDKRCNGIFDCEDGTDEYDCLCKDILNNKFPSAVCDGHVDCQDKSDEDCHFCEDDEFTCSRSGKCIPREKVCDRSPDCPLHEDEVDCLSLTNGRYINTDIEGRPHLNFEGLFSEWFNGTWRVHQNVLHVENPIDDGNNFCTYIGSSGLEKILEVPILNSTLEVKRWSLNDDIQYEYPVVNLGSVGSKNTTYNGFWIKCRPTLSFTFHSHQIKQYADDHIYTWPWEAAIFVDGKYHCPAVLLDHDWLLATSRCTENINLEKNITTILLGLLPTFKFVDGPHQVIRKVNLIRHVLKLDASVLHLDAPVNMTRYIQPVFPEKRIFPAMNDSCIATGTDNDMNTRTIFLKSISEGCPDCHRCFKSTTNEYCRKNSTNNWSGNVVCRGVKGWYPAAIFHEMDMCEFSMTQALTSIDYINAHLTETMEYDYEPLNAPKCDGKQCLLGNCVPWNKVCDGIQDCRDGADEDKKLCAQQRENCVSTNGIGCRCSKSELKCGDGKCLPKEYFCDGKVDCDDGTDEPIDCSCAQYLELTAPEKICDNKRDCWDKTDESSSLCFCKDGSFKCGKNSDFNSTDHCIPQDYVCDGINDCENGEDETACRTIRGNLKDPQGVGEVLRRSYGIWHSECFPSPINTSQYAFDICKTLSYVNGELLETEKVAEYEKALVPLRDNFHYVKLNNYTWITMRNDKPLVSLVSPQEVCHRAFVKCS